MLASLLAYVSVLLTGCNPAPTGPATVPVTGEVSLDGKPVEGALVLFFPADKSAGIKTSSAETDAEGKFTLSTHVEGTTYKPGAQAARYEVAVEKRDQSAPLDPTIPPKHLLPQRYRDPSTSGLEADVLQDGENRFVFALEK